MAAIRRARKLGWKIVRGEWLDTMNNRRCCCPMTALLLGPEGEAPPFNALRKKAAKKLGVSEGCIDEFVKGFDGDYTHKVAEASLLCRVDSRAQRVKRLNFFDLGVELRRRLRVPRYSTV